MAMINFHFSLGNTPVESANNITKAVKAATFTIVAIKEVKTVGAPSYTSGVQKWKGAADTLKLKEAKKQAGRPKDLDDLQNL